MKGYEVFAEAAKKIIQNSDMLIIARIESLIVGKSIDDAILRAKHYIDAGADHISLGTVCFTPWKVKSIIDG